MIQVDSAAISLRIVNTTSNNVFYSILVSVKANLVLGEIPEELESITGTTVATGITGTGTPSEHYNSLQDAVTAATSSTFANTFGMGER